MDKLSFKFGLIITVIVGLLTHNINNMISILYGYIVGDIILSIFKMKFWKVNFDGGERSYIHFNLSAKGFAFELFGYMVGIDF